MVIISILGKSILLFFSFSHFWGSLLTLFEKSFENISRSNSLNHNIFDFFYLLILGRPLMHGRRMGGEASRYHPRGPGLTKDDFLIYGLCNIYLVN